MYPDEWEPRYIPSTSFNIACAVAAILLVVLLRWRLQRANKKLAREKFGAGGIRTKDLETNAATSQQDGKMFTDISHEVLLAIYQRWEYSYILCDMQVAEIPFYCASLGLAK